MTTVVHPPPKVLRAVTLMTTPAGGVQSDDMPTIVDWLARNTVDARCGSAGGQTLLMLACIHGKLSAVRQLIAHGAKVDEQDRNGACALMFAAGTNGGGGRFDVVRELLSAGASVDLEDVTGMTALAYAARAAHASIVGALLLAGATGHARALVEAQASSSAHPRVIAMLQLSRAELSDLDVETGWTATASDQLYMSLDDILATEKAKRVPAPAQFGEKRRLFSEEEEEEEEKEGGSQDKDEDEEDEDDVKHEAIDVIAHRVTLEDLCGRGGFAQYAASGVGRSTFASVAAWERQAEACPKGCFQVGQELPRQEDRCHEFKAGLQGATMLDRYICAFANVKGGKLYLGVRDDGTVQGVALSRAERDRLALLVDRRATLMSPSLGAGRVHVDFHPCVGGGRAELHVVVVRVRRADGGDAANPHVHFAPGGIAWWRDNAGVRELRGEEVSRLAAERAIAADRATRKAKRGSRRGSSSASSDDYSSSSASEGSRDASPAPDRRRPREPGGGGGSSAHSSDSGAESDSRDDSESDGGTPRVAAVRQRREGPAALPGVDEESGAAAAGLEGLNIFGEEDLVESIQRSTANPLPISADEWQGDAGV